MDLKVLNSFSPANANYGQLHNAACCYVYLASKRTVGLKRIASQQLHVRYDELRYVKRRFILKEALRSATLHTYR